MIVATSRVAGLRYFNIIKEKLKERGADYKVLYAFSDFVHPESNEAISEYALNELKEGSYLQKIPKLQTPPHHPNTTQERMYGREACPAESDDFPSKLNDSGRWGYVNDKDAPCWGHVFVDCTHKDSKGVPWYDY